MPVEIPKSERTALNYIFNNNEGFTWASNFGWVGQGKVNKQFTCNLIDIYTCTVINQASNRYSGSIA